MMKATILREIEMREVIRTVASNIKFSEDPSEDYGLRRDFENKFLDIECWTADRFYAECCNPTERLREAMILFYPEIERRIDSFVEFYNTMRKLKEKVLQAEKACKGFL